MYVKTSVDQLVCYVFIDLPADRTTAELLTDACQSDKFSFLKTFHTNKHRNGGLHQVLNVV